MFSMNGSMESFIAGNTYVAAVVILLPGVTKLGRFEFPSLPDTTFIFLPETGR